MVKGMVSAPQPEAVEAGLDILASGGNAVDAAIGAALVQTAVDPQMCGIAGFGSCHLHLAEGTHTLIDFHGRAPAATRPDMWADRIVRECDDGFGFVLRDEVNEIGYQSMTTPMTLRAFDEILTRFGSRPMAEALAPAIAYCEEGFAVRPHVHDFWSRGPDNGRIARIRGLTDYPATAKIYAKPDGTIRGVGEILRNPDMGRTYRRIAEHGVEDFYSGEIARRIAEDMAANGGLITMADLAACATVETKPLVTTYRGHKVATNQPPGGGLVIALMLNILERFDLAAMGHNSPDYIATVAEAMKIATVDKDTRMGDPAFFDIPFDELLSDAYADRMAERIRRGEKTTVPRMNSGGDSKETTHICVADSAGNCVTMTHSLGSSSGVVTEGLGFMYNNCMMVFDPRPGRAGSLAPGKARFTALSPTIVFKGEKPFLLLGAPGGTTITMGNLQAILNAVDFGMDAQEAVHAPRFTATSDVIELTNRILRSTERELQSRGYPTRRHASSYMMPTVHTIRIVDGVMDGGADPSGDGMAAAV
ncbi:gamma-glutamyltransferase family protein [Pikeienuella sp. HZG-20]|uniref:gamma-glutamyltransferase family protein n=1 Tax=Paludibacillus litoralis TaxID=3133267 RepID=UPI0030EE4152